MKSNCEIKAVRPFYFGLICLAVASLCTFLAFVIVYRYVSFIRPVEHFAIVTDAGSTKTRSNLYHIRIRFEALETSDEPKSTANFSRVALNELVKIEQLSSCVNGKAVAKLESEAEASKVMSQCLSQFSRQIRRLRFVDSDGDSADLNQCAPVVDLRELDAIRDHRINSVTRLYLGATAGLRTLELVNATEARMKLRWLEAALNTSNREAVGAPTINRGYMDILSGFDEAAFSWLSVNFLCGQLSFGDNPRKSAETNPPDSQSKLGERANMIGTVELGGNSAQIAFHPADARAGPRDEHFERRNLSIFDVNYALEARSDPCIGLSQAELRVHLISVRRALADRLAKWSNDSSGALEIESPCLALGARVSFTPGELLEMSRLPCMMVSGGRKDPIELSLDADKVREIRLLGLGFQSQCDSMLSALIDPAECSKQFALCSGARLKRGPPKQVPFVTISAFNNLVGVLNLNRTSITARGPQSDNQLDTAIEQTLGGHSLDYSLFKDSVARFCATRLDLFATRYPRLRPEYRNITCFSLRYMDRLLVEFYGFSPASKSWEQLRFLILEPGATRADSPCAKAPEVGWSMGLLLNATSAELAGRSAAPTSESPDEDSDLDSSGIFYHHGSSWRFVLRTLLLLMFACLLLAVGLVLTGFVVVSRWRRQDYADFTAGGRATPTDGRPNYANCSQLRYT